MRIGQGRLHAISSGEEKLVLICVTTTASAPRACSRTRNNYFPKSSIWMTAPVLRILSRHPQDHPQPSRASKQMAAWIFPLQPKKSVVYSRNGTCMFNCCHPSTQASSTMPVFSSQVPISLSPVILTIEFLRQHRRHRPPSPRCKLIRNSSSGISSQMRNKRGGHFTA